MPHRRCVVCERVLPARGLKRVYPKQCILPKKPGVSGNAICTACYDTHRRTSQTVATVIMSDEAREFDVARAKMENNRLRYVVKTMYRRYTLNTPAASDPIEAKDGMNSAAIVSSSSSSSSSSPPASASVSSTAPLSPPLPSSAHSIPTSSASELPTERVKRKRPKAWETSTHVTNDLCEVCAEQPARKKELLFAGCLHGMCRPCMTAHLKARRHCCHVCQVDFQDRLLKVGAPITIKHALAESKNTERGEVRRRRKIR